MPLLSKSSSVAGVITCHRKKTADEDNNKSKIEFRQAVTKAK